MDIKDTIACMLNDDYTIVQYENVSFNIFNKILFTISKGNEQFNFEINAKQGDNQGIYFVKLLNLSLEKFTDAFNVDLNDLYNNLPLIKNEFDFLSCYTVGKKLIFEDFQLFKKNWMLRSELTDDYTFFCFTMEIQLLLPIPKFSLVFDYSYYDKFGGGVFEDNLITFREKFLKKYVLEDLEKSLEELSFNDYKLLHMINI